MIRKGEGCLGKSAQEKLENTLKRYWDDKHKIHYLYSELEKVEKEITVFMSILKKKEDLIPSPSNATAQLSFIPGGPSSFNEFTPVEKSLEIYDMAREKIQKKVDELIRQETNIRLKILKKEHSISWIEHIAQNFLDDEEREIFQQCYALNRKNIQVGLALSCDESTIRRKREKILDKFYRFLKSRA